MEIFLLAGSSLADVQSLSPDDRPTALKIRNPEKDGEASVCRQRRYFISLIFARVCMCFGGRLTPNSAGFRVPQRRRCDFCGGRHAANYCHSRYVCVCRSNFCVCFKRSFRTCRGSFVCLFGRREELVFRRLHFGCWLRCLLTVFIHSFIRLFFHLNQPAVAVYLLFDVILGLFIFRFLKIFNSTCKACGA